MTIDLENPQPRKVIASYDEFEETMYSSAWGIDTGISLLVVGNVYNLKRILGDKIELQEFFGRSFSASLFIEF